MKSATFAGQRELAQGFAAGGGNGGAYLQFLAACIAQRPAVQRFRLAEAEQAMIGQPGDAGRRAMSRQIGRAGQYLQAAGTQRAGVQGGVAQRADADGEVGALLQQIDDLVIAVQLQRDLRVLAAELSDQWRDHVQHERCRRIHPQPSGGALAAQCHLVLGGIHRGQDAAGVGEKGQPFLGEFQPAGSPPQQRGVQLLFQPRQRPAGAGHRLAKLFGSGGDGAAIHHGNEGEQFFQRGFHRFKVALLCQSQRSCECGPVFLQR